MLITTGSTYQGRIIQSSTSYVQAGDYHIAGGDLIRPIEVRIERPGEVDAWTVGHEYTGIYGCGPTLNDAVADFRTALREFRDVLNESPPPAGPALCIHKWLNNNMRGN